MLRFRDVYPGSRISDPRSRIPDPGSRIPDPQHCIFSINSGTEHRARGGESQLAISNRALVLGRVGSRKPNSGLDRGETFFPDSGSDLDSDETFQISRNVGLDIDEIVCLLD